MHGFIQCGSSRGGSDHGQCHPLQSHLRLDFFDVEDPSELAVNPETRGFGGDLMNTPKSYSSFHVEPLWATWKVNELVVFRGK